MTTWQELAETYYGHDPEGLELFIDGVLRAIRAYQRIQNELEAIDHRGTRDTLPEISAALDKAREKLKTLGTDSRNLVYFYIAGSADMSKDSVQQEFEHLEKLISKYGRVSAALHDHLKKNVKFVGKDNPSTYAQRNFHKRIFITYQSAFQLEEFPTIYDRKFKRILSDILEYLNLPHKDMSYIFKETLNDLGSYEK